ncbi:sulfurtransferase/chromate resistance protein [Parachitinimonas caeni]|uniref:sulfurtransferase/chromate resistance protein n=1 Tax=Parachitinimonas caeni TaxID=3031301 RepID=UPI0027E3D887|nr:sulfurtransferase/chromate resistance protein [Parachitinimonas caeni]
MLPSLTADALHAAILSPNPPRLYDVRRDTARKASGVEIDGALQWLNPADWLTWKDTISPDHPVVFYCAFGHEIAQGLTAALRAMGVEASFLEGGIAQWREQGLPVRPLPAASSQWVTRERPKIDRIACPWLISRFIDANAEFLFVPPAEVLTTAAATGATPYDIPGVELSHVGDLCSFDAFLDKYRLTDPALHTLAAIVRGADTSRLDLTLQSAGLFALSLGLSKVFQDDHTMLRHGMIMYDALYAWCQHGQAETHAWPPSLPAVA